MSFTSGATGGKYKTTDVIKHSHSEDWPSFIGAKAGTGASYGYVYNGTKITNNTKQAGNVSSISLLEPYIVTYFWMRTA